MYMNDRIALKAPGVNDAMKVVWQKHFAFLEHPTSVTEVVGSIPSWRSENFSVIASPVCQTTIITIESVLTNLPLVPVQYGF